MATYSVVHFFGDDSVEPVPSIWISKNGTCAWPTNGALIKKYIQLKTIPNEIEFVYHKARVLKTNIKSLGEANSLAEKGCIQSDLSDYTGDLMKSKRKIKEKKNQSYSDCPEYSDSDDDKSNKSDHKLIKYAGWSPSPKKFKTLKSQQKPSIVKQLSYDILSNVTDNHKNVPKSNSDKDTNEDIVEDKLEPSDVHLDKKSSEVCIRTPKLLDVSIEAVTKVTPGSSTPGKDFQKETLHMLAFIKHELRRIINNQRDMAQRLDFIEIRLNSMPTKDSSVNNKISSSLNDMTCCPLPIDNMTDLDTLESNILGDGVFRTNLVNELSYIGGKNVKSMVKRLMAKLFKDELLKNFSYTGKKGKQKFSNLATCSVIFGDRGRSRKKKRDFFGAMRTRFNRSKFRSKSIDANQHDKYNDLYGLSPGQARSISADGTRNSSEPSIDLLAPPRAGSARSSLSEMSGASGTSTGTYLNEASTLVLETTENNLKKHYLVPFTQAKKSKWKRAGVKLHIYNDHTFVAKHLSSRLNCLVCAKYFPRRIGKQGYECRDCLIKCHKECHVKVSVVCTNSKIHNIDLNNLTVLPSISA